MMKKFYVLLLFLTCLSIETFSTSKSFETDVNGIKFRIDKRMELFYTVASYAGYSYVNAFDMEYKKRIDNYFEPYEHLESVQAVKRLLPKVFGGDVSTPIFFILNLDEDLNYINKPKYVNSVEHADSLRLMLKQFAKDTDYDKFYESNKDLWQMTLSGIDLNFSDFNVKEILEDYYGRKDREFVIILNLLGSGNFGPQMIMPDGSIVGYCVIQPLRAWGKLPGFEDTREITNLIFHEFSHTYITPLVEKYADIIQKSSKLLEPIANPLRNQGYNNWATTVNEHITRAVAYRLVARKHGEQSALLADYRMELGRHFIYIIPIVEKLKEYENNRTKYKTFDEFFPELLSVFDEVTPEKIEEYLQIVKDLQQPQVSSIPDFYAALTENKDKTVIIMPTAEEDTYSKKVTDYIKDIRDNYISGVDIITDVEALGRDLSDKNIVVFGTPWGNLYLKKYISQLPIYIGKDKVVVGKEYAGDNYQFVTGWVNPQSKNMKMTIFTAQKAENIIDINKVAFAQGFILARNYKGIKSGSYLNEWGVWVIWE